jgi:hypothetical protein
MALQIVPTHWYSWDVTLADESRSVAGITLSSWREKGELTIDGGTYRVSREGMVSGDFVLEGRGGTVARATKPSVFRRELVIRYADRTYMLRPQSAFGRTFVLWEGSRELGSIAPHSAFTCKADADLPQDLPLTLRAFIVWLVLMSWKRAQSS